MNDILLTSTVQNKIKSYLKEPETQLEELVVSILLLGMGCGAVILSTGDFPLVLNLP